MFKKPAFAFMGLVCFFYFTASNVFSLDETNNKVLIGINLPLTGAYQNQGEDEFRAYKLAIDKINTEGGLLGKKVVFELKHLATNVDTSRENVKAFISKGAVMITGGVSSACAVAQAKECAASNVLFFPAVTNSNEVTGVRGGSKYSFRWYNSATQTARALAKTLVEKYGKNAKYAVLYADYSWGRDLQEEMQKVIESAGCKIISKQSISVGTRSFVPALLKVKSSDADVIVLILYGEYMISALKQANSMGLTGSKKIVVPLMELHMAKEIGHNILKGVVTSMPWYHDTALKYKGSREFVDLFEARYKKKPGDAAAVAWVNILQYAEAVKRAKSFDYVNVIKALEGHKFTLLYDEEYWRDWDHQGIHNTIVAEGKSMDESKDIWDLFNIISIKKGDEISPSREENPVKLEPIL